MRFPNIFGFSSWKTVTFVILALALATSGCAAVRGFSATPGATTVETVTLARGPMNVIISSTGTVRSAQNATLTWQAGGTVGAVNVSLGQAIVKDEALAELDPTTVSQSIIQAEVDLINAQKNLNDLMNPTALQIAQAETALEQAQKTLEDFKSPSETALNQAELGVISAQEVVDDAQYALDSLNNGRGNTQLITSAKANYLLALDKVEQAQFVYDNTPGNPETDSRKAQALSSLESAKSERDRALSSLNWYQGTPDPADIKEKEADLALAQSKLLDAQKTLEDLQSPSAADLALAEAKVADAQESLDQLKGGPSEDDLTIAQARVTLAEAALRQAAVYAPFASTVTDIQVLPGDQVTAGRAAFRVDDLSNLYVDLLVSEIDIPQVQLGQPVSVTLDAAPDVIYPGEVSEIGQVGQANSQGIVNFSVTVHLLNPDAAVRPGMTAVADIQVAQVTDVLQVPSQAVGDDNGKRFVYRMGADNTPEQVWIQVGLVSDSASEVISSELKEGDSILLDPSGGLFGGIMFGGGGMRNTVDGGGQP